MSTEARLDRLGLSHLADKPDELAQELQRGIEDYDQKVEKANAERKARLNSSASQADDKTPDASNSETPSD